MARKQIKTSIFPHSKTGIFQLRYQFADDSRPTTESLKTRDKVEAEQKRQDFIDQNASSRGDSIAILKARLAVLEAEKAVADDVPIDDIWRAFLASTKRKPITDATLGCYSNHWEGTHGLKQFIEKRCKIKGINEFTEEHAGGFVAYMAERGLSKNSAGKHITFFTRVWKVLADTENPWRNQHPQGHGRKIGRRPFNLDMQRRIISHCEGEYKVLHLILAYTGLRLVDACYLKIEEVNFEKKIIELYPQKTRNRGDNPMKAKIGLHPSLAMPLRNQMDGRSAGYFLPEIAATYERDHTAVSKLIRKQIETATGLNCTIKTEGRVRAVTVYGAHSHRKALEDAMREAGVHIMVAMKIMGHKDANSETQTYSYVKDAEVREAIEKCMPNLLISEVVQLPSESTA